jgi:hypothetical protein
MQANPQHIDFACSQIDYWDTKNYVAGYAITAQSDQCSRGSRTRQAEEKTPFDTIANKTRHRADAPISQVAPPSPPWEMCATMTSESPLQKQRKIERQRFMVKDAFKV